MGGTTSVVPATTEPPQPVVTIILVQLLVLVSQMDPDGQLSHWTC